MVKPKIYVLGLRRWDLKRHQHPENAELPRNTCCLCVRQVLLVRLSHSSHTVALLLLLQMAFIQEYRQLSIYSQVCMLPLQHLLTLH